MASPSLLPASMLESLGLSVIQQAADAALGTGVLTLADDGSGITAGLTLTSGQKLNIDDLAINAAGLSGRIMIEGLDTAPLSATLFDGFTIALTAFDLTFAQSGLAASHIAGHLTLPFFTDSAGNPKTLDVEIATKADGTVSITLSATESVQSTTPDGLVQLDYDLPGGLGSIEIDVASLEIDREADGTWKIVLSGNLVIEAASLSWPSIELRGLGITSKGAISLQGGWIDLPSQMALDFYGFHLALQKLGFGSDPSGKWIGFNGDIHLVEGLSLGGTVRGLQINLTHGTVSLDGVGISFEIPGVLSIDGEVDHIHVDAHNAQDLVNAGLLGSIFNQIAPVGPTGPKQVDVFAGQVKVVIEAAGGLEVDAGFIVGNFGAQSVFFVDIDAELPVGIPLFLDVALFGLQGLVATGLEPDPEPGATWWDWYKYPVGPALNQPPDYTATDVNKWLVPKAGAFAIGAGATIGTEADDGFTVSAAIMLVLILPGPVISLIGKANILSKRIGGANQDANFEAMATYDGNSDTFDLVIDAQYSIPVVLDMQATAELYVGGGEWYFALGKPPHDKRVKARIFDLFETDAYFVISDTGLITGTWTGYQNSWSFGPLSASLDAYLATLAAIQWSPLQIGGGIELYGNIHLSAFGIGIGLTADALLEGCAPNPFWIHGELSVELDLPWPLPNIGATISLSWGGDDGSVPPAPLALNHIDVTLVDHTDPADKPGSDHYLLLAHRANGFTPDLTAADVPLVYDAQKPGILDLTGASLTAWQGRTAASLPPLHPNQLSAVQMAPVVPQDGHFTLNFAHATVDRAGPFAAAIPWGSTIPLFPQDVETVKCPNSLGQDDMSHINPNPPSVSFVIRHSLTEVALYEFSPPLGTWVQVCACPPPAVKDPPIGVTQLSGVWLSPDPAKANPRQAMTQLKVLPWRLLPGQDLSASWNSQSPAIPAGTTFSEQGLAFSLTDVSGGAIGGLYGSASGTNIGLLFGAGGPNPVVKITFPQRVVINAVTGLIYVRDGEFSNLYAPVCSGDGNVLSPTSTGQDPASQAYSLYYSDTGPAITELTIPVAGDILLLYEIDYSTAPVPMAILPQAGALYALKTVTKIEAARVGSGSFQTVPNGDPIVEFVYFQTAAGPGTAVGYPKPATPPVPAGPAPYLALARNCGTAQQPAAAFPLAGALADLHTYTQWSWPLDGAATAYYGYDVNVEFVESYVNALYAVFAHNSVANSLHFRCVDRNHEHTLLIPNAIHVPSIPQQSALAAAAATPALPSFLDPQPIYTPPPGSWQAVLIEKQARAVVTPDRAPAAAPLWAQPRLRAQLQPAILGVRTGDRLIGQLEPAVAAALLKQQRENAAAAAVKALWLQPLQPSTLYTLDVVAGPWNRNRDLSYNDESGPLVGTFEAVQDATDALSLLAALQDYYQYEDSLTTLERVQFTTSRYATFTAQLANAAAQLAGTAATPVRRYVAAAAPAAWLAAAPLADYSTARVKFLQDHDDLAYLVSVFDPLADDVQPTPAHASNGAGALVKLRAIVAADWAAFAGATTALFDGLITALGQGQLASNQTPVAVPDTEISFFTDSTGETVQALLLQSPEPIQWQRVARWTTLVGSTGSSDPLVVLWSADQTTALLVPLRPTLGRYTLTMVFQGNIGAEAPCITQGGTSVTEPVVVGTIAMSPVFVNRPFPVEHPLPVGVLEPLGLA